MFQPLLSVIVPCYNVEKYVDKCISSIVNQNYPNIEIILIDDGSTDSTGVLCDAWQGRDSRIRVIHKQNEGSSYARKTGVENATAEYITFVDSDDWIDKNMYINMLNALLSTNSDIAQCGVCDAYEDGRIEYRTSEHKDGSFEIFDRTNGVLLITKDKEWISYLGNKIFKKHLFCHIEFPKGRGACEDVSIMHILFHHVSQSVYLRDEYYYYFRRSGSITIPQSLSSKMKNWFDAFNAFYERYCFVEQYPEYYSGLIYVKNEVISSGIRALRNSIIYPQYFPKDYSNSLQKQLNAVSFIRKDILKESITPLMRVEISIFFISPTFYKRLIILYTKIIYYLKRNQKNNMLSY